MGGFISYHLYQDDDSIGYVYKGGFIAYRDYKGNKVISKNMDWKKIPSKVISEVLDLLQINDLSEAKKGDF